MKTLDRQKSFGTINGDTEGRFYVQDGVYFDSCDREIKEGGAKAPAETKTVTTITKAPAEAKVDTKVDEQLGKQ